LPGQRPFGIAAAELCEALDELEQFHRRLGLREELAKGDARIDLPAGLLNLMLNLRRQCSQAQVQRCSELMTNHLFEIAITPFRPTWIFEFQHGGQRSWISLRFR